jgi:hypothetical protein
MLRYNRIYTLYSSSSLVVLALPTYLLASNVYDRLQYSASCEILLTAYVILPLTNSFQFSSVQFNDHIAHHGTHHKEAAT